MEIEKDCSSENLRDTIIINSDNYLILHDINLKTELSLRVSVDMKNNSIRNNNQLYFANVMQAFNKAEIIELIVGMRYERKKESNMEEQGDWIHFIKGIGQSTKTLVISIGDYILNRSNLAQFGQELLRLNFLEKFHLQISKEKNFGVTGFTQLGEALRRMTQLKDLSIFIGDNCSLGVNGAKKLFCGIEACEKIQKLQLYIGSYNRLNAEGTQMISIAVGQLKKVNDLDLYIAKTNDIGNQGMQYITNNILQQHLSKSAENLSLKVHDMKAIKMESIVQIFSSIEGFSKLKGLSVELGVKSQMKEDSIKIIQDSLKKLTSLLRISICLNSDPYALYVTPMVDLLTRFQLSDNLMSLKLVIPPHNEFNNSALSLFAANLKRLQQLQVFSLEIQENNLKENTIVKRKGPLINKNRKTNKKAKEEIILQARGISDISESLGNLKKLEIVEWIVSTQNDVSDGGWEMLSRSRSLREFRVKIGERCKLLDEGLHSLSKISSSVSLNCLRIEVENENETSQTGWSNLLRTVNYQKMKDFQISIGSFNECSGKSLEQLAATFERISPRIECLILEMKDSNNISSDSIQQLSDSLKSMISLKQLVFKMPEDTAINSAALDSLSNSLEKMSQLEYLRVIFRIQENVRLLNEMKLCQTICSLRKLHYLNLHVEGQGSLNGSSIISQVDSSMLAFSLPSNKEILEFRTENGLQFHKQLKREHASQYDLDKLAESLALFVQASQQQQIVYLKIKIDTMNVTENCPEFTQFFNILSEFKKCIKLKLNLQKHFFSEISLNQLADSIVCMSFLSKLSLRLDFSILPLKAAETLAAFFENSPRITKVLLICKSNPDIDQSQAQFLLLSSILTCPNLRRFQVLFESNSKIQFDYKKHPKIEDLLQVSSMEIEGEVEKRVADKDNEGQEIAEETNENMPLEESFFQFLIEDSQELSNDESLIHLGKFLMSTKVLQGIKLRVFSAKQISTEIAKIIQKGIMDQVNLIDLHLEFIGKCFVSGEGAVLLSQSFANQKNKKNKVMYLKTDDTFSIDYALTALVGALNYQNLQMKRDHLEINGTKFFLTTDRLNSNRKYIFKTTSPKQIALCQGIRLDQSESILISQIVDKLSELKNVSDLDFNASENFQIINQDWSSFQQLSSLALVSIQDTSPITSSRFLSLESSLSHMAYLKSLTLNLSHIHENVSSQKTIIPFGKCLNNLKQITQFTITLQDFNFGQDGGQALGYGIEGMTDLEVLEIKCYNPQNLLTEGIKQWCKCISKLSKIYQLNLNFFGVHSLIEFPFFGLLKNLLLDKQKSLKRSSIQVNGEINQAFGYIRKFSQSTTPIDLNSHRSLLYEFQLPSKYCFRSVFENEAFNKCTDILQVYYSSSNETYSIKDVTVVFDFTKLEQIEPNLIFLKTLFSVLQQQQRRVKLLKIVIYLCKNGQFPFIFESALKDIKQVDAFFLYFSNSYSYEYNIKEFNLITSLDTLTNLKIIIMRSQNNLKQFKQRIIRKMKRLCHCEFTSSF